MKTSEPKIGGVSSINVGPAETGVIWDALDCNKFMFNERINRWLCRTRAEQFPDVGRVDCRECEDRPELRK